MNNPLFNGVHEEPRWLAFLRAMGLTPEELAKINFGTQLPG